MCVCVCVHIHACLKLPTLPLCVCVCMYSHYVAHCTLYAHPIHVCIIIFLYVCCKHACAFWCVYVLDMRKFDLFLPMCMNATVWLWAMCIDTRDWLSCDVTVTTCATNIASLAGRSAQLSVHVVAHVHTHTDVTRLQGKCAVRMP